MSAPVKIFVLIFLAAFFISLNAQEQPSKYDQYISEAVKFIKERNYEKAEESLDEAIDLNPRRSEAYFKMAEFKMEIREWGDAKSALKKVLEHYPDQIQGHYLMGICDRNDAMYKDLIRRRLLQRYSRIHFERVIEIDSTYKEVLNEFARLKRDQQNYQEAVILCLRQLNIKPHAKNARYDIFTYYDLFLYYGSANTVNLFGDNDKFQLDWLEKRTTDYDAYFIGEKYRRTGSHEKADSIFQILSQKKDLDFNKTPLRLSMTRLYYQMGQPENAERKFWEAVNNVRIFSEFRFIFDDIFFIMSSSDLAVQFNTIDDIKKYYHRFWNRKNPLAGSNFNERLAEHYSRLVKAEKDFNYHGARLTINNPDKQGYIKIPELLMRNNKLNDKGLVYVRYGEPDEHAQTSEQNVSSNESWLYKAGRNNPKLIFHFEVAPHGSPGDWRLVSAPTNQIMLESRRGWDVNLDRLSMADDELEYSSALHEVRMTTGKTINKALTRERHSWAEEILPIPIALSTAQFRDVQDKNLFDVNIGIPAEYFEKSDDSLALGWEVFNTDWDKIDEFRLNEYVSLGDSAKFKHGHLLHRFSIQTDLDKIYAAVYARDLDSTRMGGFKFAVERKDFGGEEISLSELVTAYHVEPLVSKNDKFYKHGFSVVPNPAQKFKTDEFVYC